MILSSCGTCRVPLGSFNVAEPLQHMLTDLLLWALAVAVALRLTHLPIPATVSLQAFEFYSTDQEIVIKPHASAVTVGESNVTVSMCTAACLAGNMSSSMPPFLSASGCDVHCNQSTHVHSTTSARKSQALLPVALRICVVR